MVTVLLLPLASMLTAPIEEPAPTLTVGTKMFQLDLDARDS